MLIVPAKLGYGTEGKGKVPPGATLVYEIEAVRVSDGQRALAVNNIRQPVINIVYLSQVIQSSIPTYMSF